MKKKHNHNLLNTTTPSYPFPIPTMKPKIKKRKSLYQKSIFYSICCWFLFGFLCITHNFFFVLFHCPSFFAFLNRCSNFFSIFLCECFFWFWFFSSSCLTKTPVLAYITPYSHTGELSGQVLKRQQHLCPLEVRHTHR